MNNESYGNIWELKQEDLPNLDSIREQVKQEAFAVKQRIESAGLTLAPLREKRIDKRDGIEPIRTFENGILFAEYPGIIGYDLAHVYRLVWHFETLSKEHE
jgi:hypothetical protein